MSGMKGKMLMVSRNALIASFGAALCCAGCESEPDRMVSPAMTNTVESVQSSCANDKNGREGNPDSIITKYVQKFSSKIAHWLGPAKTDDKNWWLKD